MHESVRFEKSKYNIKSMEWWKLNNQRKQGFSGNIEIEWNSKKNNGWKIIVVVGLSEMWKEWSGDVVRKGKVNIRNSASIAKI